MTIEEKAFLRRRFVSGLMTARGFERTDGGYRLERTFMDGDFTAVLTVSDEGTVSGSVIDNMNAEEYTRIRSENFGSPYVTSVRTAYEELLAEIAGVCCEEMPFASEQGCRIASLIAEKYGAAPDFPWSNSKHDDSGVFRHTDSGKWFGLIMNVKRSVLTKDGDSTLIDLLNLKTDPDSPAAAGVYPAYHMNHRMWISVPLDDSLADDEVMELVGRSFRLTDKKKK